MKEIICGQSIQEHSEKKMKLDINTRADSTAQTSRITGNSLFMTGVVLSDQIRTSTCVGDDTGKPFEGC